MSEADGLHTQPHTPEPVATGGFAPTDSAAMLVRVLDDYLADLQAGRAPDRAQLLTAHPDLAAQLEQCLSGIEFVHRAAQPAPGAPTQLGDFRIVREVGRGGMGVVYEAEQESLQRRVALKVLRFGAVADREAMQRFQREAETVARLHHTNIVPIFAVGCEQGVHYYAMQFIEGKSLAAILEEAQRARSPDEENPSLALRLTMDSKQIAGLGLQAAEALAHAHARGVIHRDIKPSNLILDHDGCLWLTDFGLAKRIDEVTLTMTGVLMGTPRYMSPEQAAAVKQPVDHRTDVYSLGATLYELATGKPVFDAATPQGVITQILHDEPIAPRLIRSQLPRDLETILLKCLAKDPGRRYPTAHALAEDLRAFLDGRPIAARRPSLIERSARWLHRHRRSAALIGVTAAAAMLFMALGLSGVEQWRQWQKGSLFLRNEGPVLTGELLDEQGRRVQPRFTVPTEEALSVPAGSYNLRLQGRGFIDEMFQVRIERGKEMEFDGNLNDQWLWPPLAVPATYELVKMGNHTDVLPLSAEGLSRIHGGTGATLWTVKLGEKEHAALAGFHWDWSTQGIPTGRGEYDRRPRLVQPAPDLDGDGVPDLVWVSRRQAAVLALSGKDGGVLWCFQAPSRLEPDSRYATENGSTGTVVGTPGVMDVNGDGIPDLIVTFVAQKQADGTVPRWVEALSGRKGESLWRYDLDDTWFAPPLGGVPQESRWNNDQGLSISSGGGWQSVANSIYDKDWGSSSSWLAVPYPATVARAGDRPAVVLVAGKRLIGLDPHSGKPLWPAHDLGFWPLRPPQLADLDGSGKDSVLLLGPPEGRERRPSGTDLAFDPYGGSVLAGGPGGDDRLTLAALTLTTRQRLWDLPLAAYWGWNWFQEPFEWPLVVDLDGDGRPEVIVPTGGFEGASKWSGVQVCDGATGTVRWVRKLTRSGRYGQVQQVNRLIVGPDLEGDGCRDIFTAVLDGTEWPRDQWSRGRLSANLDKDYIHPVVQLDALSGRDGHSLWWLRQRTRSGSLTTGPKPSLAPLRWWHAGTDGWPQLVVPYVPGSPQDSPSRHTTWFVSACTGKLLHTASDYRDVRTADLDGDGTLDLVSFRADQPDAFDQGGKLEMLRGRSPEAWRRLGGFWQPAGDLDGDGFPDLVTAQPDFEREREAAKKPKRERDDSGKEPSQQEPEKKDKPLSTALSGRDGHVLWEHEINDDQRRYNSPWDKTLYTRLQPLGAGGPSTSPERQRRDGPVAGAPGLCAGDLDGDGVPDLLITGKTHSFFGQIGGFCPLLAVSGKTGKRLWSADIDVEVWNGPQLLACHDLDGDGKPEVLFVSAMDWGWPRQSTQPNAGKSSNDWQYWLAVLSGRDGKVRWKQPLCEGGDHRGSQPAMTPFAYLLADLNGDGVLDVVIETGNIEGKGEVRAFSGKDGTLLWHSAPTSREGDQGSSWVSRPTLALGDLEGNGKPTVIALRNISEKDDQGKLESYAEIAGLDGSTGKAEWTWREPVDYGYNDSTNGAVLSRVVPLIINLDGKKAVCVWTYSHKTKAQIVLLDAHGKELIRQPLKFRLTGDYWKHYRDDPQDTCAPYYGRLFRIWAHDLDGNGTDELIVFTADKLRVMAAGMEKVVWEWPLPDEDCDLLEIRPPTADTPALLVVRAGSRVVALSGKDGTPRWDCTGAGKPLAVAWTGTRPRVIYDVGGEVTACRLTQAANTAEDEPTVRGFEPYRAPTEEDPRLVEPLPWVPLVNLPPLLPSSPVALLGTLLGSSLAVMVVPAGLLVFAVRRRTWGVAWLAVPWLVVVWGGAYMWFLTRLEEEADWHLFQHGPFWLPWRFGCALVVLALVGLPAVAFAGTALLWLRRRHWLRLGLLLVAALLLATVIGVIWVRFAARELFSEQHFSFRGWYAIWPAGVYAVGVLLLAAYSLRGLIWFVRWRKTRGM
jgi:serine/threonine protein kinase